jgi:hypothetical protein
MARHFKFLKTKYGYEVYSNDEKIKYILRLVVVNMGSMEKITYSTAVYFKDGKNWVRSSDAHTFPTEEEFLRTIRSVDEFSDAAREMREMTRKA